MGWRHNVSESYEVPTPQTTPNRHARCRLKRGLYGAHSSAELNVPNCCVKYRQHLVLLIVPVHDIDEARKQVPTRNVAGHQHLLITPTDSYRYCYIEALAA